MRLSAGTTTGALLALVLTLFVSTSVQAQRAEVTEALNQGISLFEQGKLDEAAQKFEAAWLLDPTADEALQWLDEVGMAKLVKAAASEHDQLSKQVARVLELTATETRRRERDQARIDEALSNYFGSDDYMETQRVLLRAITDHGIYLMPGLVERLAVAETTTRIAAVQALKRLSDDAVIPLCRVLNHDDVNVLQGAISVLKNIGNSAAVPSLKRLAETATDSAVKGAALNAIEAIDGAATQSSAYDLLVDQAGQFFRDSTYMVRSYHDPVIWSLNGGALEYKSVHAWAVNELRAEQILADALSVDGASAPARVLNTCNKFAQYAEYVAVRDVVARKVESGDMDESRINDLRGEELQMFRVRNLYPGSQPMSVLLGAVDWALDERRPEVATEAIMTIRDMVTVGRRNQSVPEALVRAQTYDHRGVRFAAAECIARMNPANGFADSAQTITNLCEGLTLAGARVALTVIPNQDLALKVSGLLFKSNVIAFNEVDTYQGLQRAQSFPPEDVIVISTDYGKSQGPGSYSPAELISRLRADFRTKNIPILVVAEDSKLAAAEQTYANEENNVRVINASIDANRLRDEILKPLLDKDTTERDRDGAISARAAEALLDLASRDNGFDLSAASGALVSVLENRDDSVRVPAARALGILGTERATPALVRICKDDSTSTNLLGAALIALGDINRGKGSVEPMIQEVIDKAKNHNEPAIMQAGARVEASITPAMMRKN